MLDAPAGDMPPLHAHRNEDEGFYVVAGELTLFLSGTELRLRPGDFVLAPCGVPHSYRVESGPARYLVMTTPAGFEGFVRDVAALDAADPERLAAIAAHHGIDVLGPPGMLP
jgi:quercetin dioxygenase-like cupin family protein